MQTRSFFSVLMICFVVLQAKATVHIPEANESNGPKITLIAPGENDILQIGKAIHFDMDLNDEVLLESYRVEIHENFDGHAHSKENEGKVFPIIFDRTWDVSGVKQKQVHHHGIVIPADAKEGVYHFVIYCTNAEGKKSQIIRTVHLSKGPGTRYHHH